MTPKKTITKTQRQKTELAYEYGARMVNTYEEPLTADMALERNNQRYWKPTRSQMQGALHDAAHKGLVTKFRDPHFKRVAYAKLDTATPTAVQATPKPKASSKKMKIHATVVTEYRFNARQIVDQLHELDVRLYEQVLDTISESVGLSHSAWVSEDGDMIIRSE